MSKALSLDLRTRVLAAISDGLSCRQAAQRFGVSASSAIRWRSLERCQGHARPKALGGDRRSGRIEAHGPLILALVWRFFARRRITRKKRLLMSPSRTGRTS